MTVWYRSFELLIDAKHYTPALGLFVLFLSFSFFERHIDIWAIGCIFAELITLHALFQVRTDESFKIYQSVQVRKMFSILGDPRQYFEEKFLDNFHWWKNALADLKEAKLFHFFPLIFKLPLLLGAKEKPQI